MLQSEQSASHLEVPKENWSLLDRFGFECLRKRRQGWGVWGDSGLTGARTTRVASMACGEHGCIDSFALEWHWQI
eukprot:1271301-Amphidinium_carterae.1